MRRTAWCGALAALCLAIPSFARAVLALGRAADLADLRPGQIADLFLTGLRLDGMIAGSVVLPVAVLLLLAPERWLAGCLAALRWHAGLIFFLLCTAEIAGGYFFDYYDLRPNHLVLDHAADPEVVATLLSAYPVAWILAASLAGALLAAWLQPRLARRAPVQPARRHSPTAQAPCSAWSSRGSPCAGRSTIARSIPDSQRAPRIGWPTRSPARGS